MPGAECKLHGVRVISFVEDESSFECLFVVTVKEGFFQVALVVKNPPVKAGDVSRCRFDPLGQEDPLEKGTATYSSILAWRIPWIEEPGGLWSDHTESDTTKAT